MATTPITRLMRIGWRSVGKILARVVADRLDRGRLDGLVMIGVDEVSQGANHRFLTCVANHQSGGALPSRGRRHLPPTAFAWLPMSDSSSRRMGADGRRRRCFAQRPSMRGPRIPLALLGDCDSAPSLLDRRFLASTITSCVGIDRTEGRRDLDHRAIAWPGEAVISSLPTHALLQLVLGDSEISTVASLWRCKFGSRVQHYWTARDIAAVTPDIRRAPRRRTASRSVRPRGRAPTRRRATRGSTTLAGSNAARPCRGRNAARLVGSCLCVSLLPQPASI